MLEPPRGFGVGSCCLRAALAAGGGLMTALEATAGPQGYVMDFANNKIVKVPVTR